jgi:hypothetical protein
MLQSEDIIDALAKITPLWLGGFFDGEGSVAARTSGNSYSVDVSITQKDPKILGLISLRFPDGNIDSKTNSTGHICYQLRWRGRTAIPILKYLQGYTIVKYRQIEIALKSLALVGTSGKPITTDELKEREKLAKELRQFVKEGNVSGGESLID